MQPDVNNKFIFKVINAHQIAAFCGTLHPTDQQISRIIEPWIYVTPKTPHIVNAYEVYKDKFLYLQLTEYCEGYDDVYDRVKTADFGLLTEVIPKQLVRMVYLFTIQVSHAFAIAHAANLTHGLFDLT